jgi:hypothetical protein
MPRAAGLAKADPGRPIGNTVQGGKGGDADGHAVGRLGQPDDAGAIEDLMGHGSRRPEDTRPDPDQEEGAAESGKEGFVSFRAQRGTPHLRGCFDHHQARWRRQLVKSGYSLDDQDQTNNVEEETKRETEENTDAK